MKENDKPSLREIPDIRQEIDSIDETILELLARRREMSREVARSKVESEAPLRDQAREQQLLVDRIRRGEAKELDRHFVTRIFQEIIDDSLRQQHHTVGKIGRDSVHEVRTLTLPERASDTD